MWCHVMKFKIGTNPSNTAVCMCLSICLCGCNCVSGCVCVWASIAQLYGNVHWFIGFLRKRERERLFIFMADCKKTSAQHIISKSIIAMPEELGCPEDRSCVYMCSALALTLCICVVCESERVSEQVNDCAGHCTFGHICKFRILYFESPPFFIMARLRNGT